MVAERSMQLNAEQGATSPQAGYERADRTVFNATVSENFAASTQGKQEDKQSCSKLSCLYVAEVILLMSFLSPQVLNVEISSKLLGEAYRPVSSLLFPALNTLM